MEEEQKQADSEMNKKMTKLVREYSMALKTIRAELAQAYAGKYTYEHLNKLEQFIKYVLGQLHYKNAQLLKTTLIDIYSDVFYMTSWAIEKYTNVSLIIGVLNPQLIEKAVFAPIANLTLVERLERNRSKVIAMIRSELTQGLILGRSYEETAKRIKSAIEIDAKKSILIARTESHRIRNTARVDSAKRAESMGLEVMKVWDATLDKRTRIAHGKLDGKKVAVNDDFVTKMGGRGPAPGMMGNAGDDCNCRCSMRLEIKGFEPSERRVRREGIGKYQTYENWLKSKGFK